MDFINVDRSVWIRKQIDKPRPEGELWQGGRPSIIDLARRE